jgi:hypothetical protein
MAETVVDPIVEKNISTEPENAVMRKFSRALSRTATFTQEITETVQFLTDTTRAEEILEQQEEDARAAAEAEAILATPPDETPTHAERRHTVTEQIGEGFLNPDRIMLKDKIVFFVGVVNVALIAFWVGASPGTYYHYWAFKCFLLFPLRWWIYKKKGWHYLMLELCYFGNLIGIAHLYYWRESIFLRKMAFAYSAGPLMCSIIAMRNSLVFHDFDKTTTLMMHASPAIVAWTMRWFPEASWIASLTKDQLVAMNTSSWYEMFVQPVAVYFVWVFLYYIITFVLLRHRIEGRGRATMFSIMVPKNNPEAAKRSALARVVLKAPEHIQPIVYLACHAVAASFSFLHVKWCFDNFYLHTLFLAYCLGLSIWNGGNYYFKVFAKKYLMQLQEKAGKPADSIAYHDKKAN